MKKFLPSFFLKLLLIILLINFCNIPFVKAQGRVITLSGYTADVIADSALNVLPSSLTSTSVDLPTDSGYVFFVQGYSSTSTPFSGGLPPNGQFTDSAGRNFKFAPYNANNDLRLAASQSGTLTFATSDSSIAYDTLFILATGGSGFDTTHYTINFTDLSTTSGKFIVLDWLNTYPPYTLSNLSRVGRIGGGLDSVNLNKFVIRGYPIVLSAGDTLKHIKSITFSVLSGETAVTNIFGITGNTSIISSLPVTLEYYTASLVNGKALLQWKTSQEFNNKQFIVERSTSTDPSSFVEVGRVNALSSANGSLYNFTDDPGVSGTFLYRLKQEDIDGQIKILGIKSVTFNSKVKWVVQDLGTEWRLICEQPFTYQLLDFNGRILKAASGSGSATISKPASQGIYQIQVQAGGVFSTQKLLK